MSLSDAIAVLEEAKKMKDNGAFRKSREDYQRGMTILKDLATKERDPSKRDILQRELIEYDIVIQSLSLRAADETMKMALSSDERQAKNRIDLYLEAVELYIAHTRFAESKGEDCSAVKTRASKILDRVAEIKGATCTKSNTQAAQGKVQSEAPQSPVIPLPAPPSSVGMAKGRQKLTEQELAVIRTSSFLNGKIFFPFLDNEEDFETFAYDSPFCDPDGLLQLSQAQIDSNVSWLRPKEFLTKYYDIHSQPVMVETISPYLIKQEGVGDCSFISSLCITAEYQRRFGHNLITGIIYPQSATGIPIFNPSGKYLVKLFINGIARKVVVDDRLPVNMDTGQLLCAKSTNPLELWVSIIEKAYMKLNGGYHFPGSNSGIDLYCLTGWIPEKISFDPESALAEDVDRSWERILSAHKYGDCLITISTSGSITEEDEVTTGLVSGHAYAVLDVKEAGRLRMLKVKNPWSSRPWRGKFSSQDRDSWTIGLKKVLGISSETDFDVMEEQGLSWMEFADVRKFFRRVYLNWNPALFKSKTTVHGMWPKELGPKNDKFYVGDNPQYALTIDFKTFGSSTPVTIWILLTRHLQSSIQTKPIRRIPSGESAPSTPEDDVQDDIFLTFHIYNGSKRIYSPGKAYVDGVYSNDPHTLLRLDIDPKTVTSPDKLDRYMLVLSQLAKAVDITYTISIFSTIPFLFSPAPSMPTGYRQEIQGVWNDESSGGSSEFYNINPQYRLVLEEDTSDIHIQLFYPPNIRGSIMIVLESGMLDYPHEKVPIRTDNPSRDCELASSGPYRLGFCHCSCSLPAGSYNVIFSNYYVSMKGKHRGMFAASSSKVFLRQIPSEAAGLNLFKEDASWSISAGTAAGCGNFGNYMLNPTYRIDFPGGDRKSYCIGLRLRTQFGSSASTNISVYRILASGKVDGTSPKQALCTSFKGVYSNFQCGASIPLTWLSDEERSGCSLAVIVSTFEPLETTFTLEIYSNLESICSCVSRIQ